MTAFYFDSARDLFEAARAASKDAERCRLQLERMQARAASLGGGGFEPRVASTPDPQRMSGRIDAYVDRERALRERMEEDYGVIDLACRVLYGHDNETGLSVLVPLWWCDVLWWRYLDGATWERVGEAVGYSAHRCWEVAAQALDICDGWGIPRVMQGVGCAEG